MFEFSRVFALRSKMMQQDKLAGSLHNPSCEAQSAPISHLNKMVRCPSLRLLESRPASQAMAMDGAKEGESGLQVTAN